MFLITIIVFFLAVSTDNFGQQIKSSITGAAPANS